MKCLQCGFDTKVVISIRKQDSVFRRRKCIKCGEVFHTREVNDALADELFSEALYVKNKKAQDLFKAKKSKQEGEQNNV